MRVRARRVMVKARVVKLAGVKAAGAAAVHLRYLQRDGVTREGEHGRFYSTFSDDVDGKAFLERLKERSENRDKEIKVTAFMAQLEALRVWGLKEPADLSAVKNPVFVVNGDNDRMVPTKNSEDLARRLPNSSLTIYPDSGHGAVFQYYSDFVPKALAFLAR